MIVQQKSVSETIMQDMTYCYQANLKIYQLLTRYVETRFSAIVKQVNNSYKNSPIYLKFLLRKK